MENEDLYEKARKKVKAKKGFFYHLLAYLFTIGMLYAIMYFENNGEMLPVIIVSLSWGIGLAGHYLTAFGTENLETFGINPNWEEDELERELERLTRKRELRNQINREKSLLDESETLDLNEGIKKPLKNDNLI